MTAPENHSIKRPVKIALAVAAIALTIVAIGAFRDVFVVAAVGLLVAVLLEPVIRFFRQKLRLKHALSVALAALLLVGLLGGVLYIGYTLVAGQVRNLAERGPEIRDRVVNRVNELTDQFSWLGFDNTQFRPSDYLQEAGVAVLGTLKVGLDGLTFAVIVFFLALFIAGNFREYGQGCLTLFPPRRRPRVKTLAQGSARIVRRWFLCQLMVVAISATLTAIMLLIIGFDYWLVIAALTLVLGFIPFFGAILTGFLAVVLTMGTEPEKVWWVLLAYVVIQQVEGDVLLPLIMKGRIQLPEAHLLLFVLLMGSALGMVGIFLAPPVFAVLYHLYTEAYIPWIERTRPREADQVVATPDPG